MDVVYFKSTLKKTSRGANIITAGGAYSISGERSYFFNIIGAGLISYPRAWL